MDFRDTNHEDTKDTRTREEETGLSKTFFVRLREPRAFVFKNTKVRLWRTASAARFD
jgi:hypothetical protein